MANKKGWRGYIYDAPWARFASGQSGVIISDDGRECETWDNNISSIQIYADPNTTFEDRGNGHILFRQKGSDLYDIVCLNQGEGGTYYITVSRITATIDGCHKDCNVKYQEFLSSIKVTEFINGVEHVADNNRKAQLVIMPTYEQVCNGYLDNDENNTKPKSITVKGTYQSASSIVNTIVRVKGPTTTTQYVRTSGINQFSGKAYVDTPHVEITYDVVIDGGSPAYSECSGKTVQFNAIEHRKERKKYTIFPLTGISFNNIYSDTKCGSSTERTVVSSGVTKWILSTTEGVYNYYFENANLIKTPEGDNNSYTLRIELNEDVSLSSIKLLATPYIEGQTITSQFEITLPLP